MGAIGVVVNQSKHAAISITASAVGNHAVVRSKSGLEEGVVSASRNQQGSEQKTKGKGKGGRQPKHDWREHILDALVPSQSQQLLFVAVALIDQHWEFCLESLSAEQIPPEGLYFDKEKVRAQRTL